MATLPRMSSIVGGLAALHEEMRSFQALVLAAIRRFSSSFKRVSVDHCARISCSKLIQGQGGCDLNEDAAVMISNLDHPVL